MKGLKDYALTLLMLIILGVLFFIKKDTATSALQISLSSVGSMLKILPPILITMNLLDVLIPKEVVIRHMGHDAGLKGYLWALILATFAAGPLYAAFPIAALLGKKDARLSYLIFFLGMWTVTKLPVFTYELEFFGVPFTSIHVVTGIIFYYFLSIILEKVFLKNEKQHIYRSLAEV
ncbi:hypothetical protein EXM22_02135 [Oceanispirochaeta crateris]|uniref:Permease n=1 Tax=Oceanispirochaeta crateris TaxID=2518645 RepID=A0A5C1QHU2_9SPIO|nr:hypothetical protein [Oceanispirochaeta crateris]QEN06848.1 hypothetical protein EXM22_02135 [Oceanispirochaeta crateris]